MLFNKKNKAVLTATQENLAQIIQTNYTLQLTSISVGIALAKPKHKKTSIKHNSTTCKTLEPLLYKLLSLHNDNNLLAINDMLAPYHILEEFTIENKAFIMFIKPNRDNMIASDIKKILKF